MSPNPAKPLRRLLSSLPTPPTALVPMPQTHPPQPILILILGAPGTGKGTQSAILQHSLGVAHVSYGDVLRAEQKMSGSVVSTCARRPESEGGGVVVSGGVAVGLIRREIYKTAGDQQDEGRSRRTRKSKTCRVLLVDGFPRNGGHLPAWFGEMPVPRLVVYLHCDESTSASRIAARAASSGRPTDADPAKVDERVRRFHREFGPVLPEFRSRGVRIEMVDTAGRSVEDVARELEAYIRDVVPRDLLKPARQASLGVLARLGGLGLEGLGRFACGTYRTLGWFFS